MLKLLDFFRGIDVDRIELYLVVGVIFVFIGAATFSIGLAFILAGCILILVGFSAMTTIRARVKDMGNGPSRNN